MTTYPASLPRILSLLVLSGLCFQSGRWVEQLTARAEGAGAVVAASARAAAQAVDLAPVASPAPAPEASSAPAEPVPGATAGSPVGSGDLITPLYARDPTSLIMGPGAGFGAACPNAAAVAPPSAPVPPHLVPRGGFIAPENY